MDPNVRKKMLVGRLSSRSAALKPKVLMCRIAASAIFW